MEFSLDRFYQINRKAIIWIVLGLLIYVLRDFFTLIFMTFIVGFFAMPASNWMMRRFHMSRGFAITTVYLSIFLGYIALAFLIVPSLMSQAVTMQGKLPTIQASLFELRDEYAEKYPGPAKMMGVFAEPALLREGDILGSPRFYRALRDDFVRGVPSPGRRVMELLGEDVRAKVEEAAQRTEPTSLFEPDPAVENEIIGAINERILKRRDFYRSWEFGSVNTTSNENLRELLERNATDLTERESQHFNRMLLEAAFPDHIVRGRVAEDELEATIDEVRAYVQATIQPAARQIGGFFMTSLLAIFFSFLIAYDYARLSKEVRSLATSKLRDFYEEAGQPVVRFALSVGKGFQALVIIAFLTTLIFIPVLMILRIEAITLLALIIFVTSLVPVLGVPIEAAAILLVAFNSQGVWGAVWAGVATVLIHLFIGNVVGPIVLGRQFRMNMVAIILILYFGNRIGGVWGMILGVPIANYLLRDVLKAPFVDDRDDRDESEADLGKGPGAGSAPRSLETSVPPRALESPPSSVRAEDEDL